MLVGTDMIDVREDTFKLKQAFTISRGSRVEVKVLTVTIVRDGFIGRGECVPYARYGETVESVSAQIKALPQDIGRRDLQSALPAGAARNAVDCALWDLEAKSLNCPAWEIANLQQPVAQECCYTISLDTPENMHVSAKENAHRPILKVKLGTPDDLVRLEAVRNAAPDSKLVLDANEGWTGDIYSELIPHLQRLKVVMVEQPLPASEDDALLDLQHPVTICADESCHDRKSLDSLKGKYDMINIKLDKSGGLTEALKLRNEAIASGFDIMVGCMVGSSLAMAPALLVAQKATITDLDGPLLLSEDRDTPLSYDNHQVHPANQELWG